MMSSWQIWGSLLAATLGTYICRAVGVAMSGRIDQESEIFRWLSAVTYAMVAALVVRMIIMPMGTLATVPLWVRVAVSALSLGVMVSSPTRRLVPALLTGTLLLVIYGAWR